MKSKKTFRISSGTHLQLLIVTALAACALSSCHVVRFFIWNFADIRDYRKFQKMEIPKGDSTFVFANARPGTSFKLPGEIRVKKRKYDFEGLLHKSGTVAFLVIRNDSILFQEYLRGYSEASIVPSFSMAKSFVSMLVGIAIDEGAINSVQDPITRYLPELTDTAFNHITIRDLLNMRSGIAFNENYINPFGDIAKYYYGVNLRKYVTRLRVAREPGHEFEYKSVNTELLAMIVEHAVHKPLAEYMEEKIWRYIGAEYDASWSIDSRKDMEVKAYCCFNARARDFAKLGRLYLHKGNWNGRQIVPEKWVNESLDITTNHNQGTYSYQWWHTRDAKGKDFFADGLLGQYVYVYPGKNMILVRLGKKEGYAAWPSLMRAIAEAN